MKFLTNLALAVVLIATACAAPFAVHKPEVSPKSTPVTVQQTATHMLTFMKYGREAGLCTGTAIAPHAILTAHHCNEDGSVKTLHLDLTLQEEFHIEKILTDGRDHDIYLVDGPAFTNVAFYKTRPTKAGEKVYLWGDGGGEYPPRQLSGTEAFIFQDRSDVDARNHLIKFSMLVIPGDSGSAVWSEDGNIVAVTTYLWTDEKHDKTIGTVDFEPAFTDEQLAEEESFAPAPWVAVEATKPPLSFPFMFGFPPSH